VNGPVVGAIDWMGSGAAKSGKTKAMKLDFKSGGAFYTWLDEFGRNYLSMVTKEKVRKVDLILNANVVRADGGGAVTIGASEFARQCEQVRLEYAAATGGEGRVIVSLAFAEMGSSAYSRDDVRKMLEVVGGLEFGGGVTVVLKADKLLARPEVLEELLVLAGRIDFVTVYGVNEKNEGRFEKMMARYPGWVGDYVLVEKG